MSRDLEERIVAIAVRQHGVVTCAQLRQAGLSQSGIARRIGSGRLHVLHRGVYMAVPYALPHTAEMAAVVAIGPGAVVSHLSAARLLGLSPDPGNGRGSRDRLDASRCGRYGPAPKDDSPRGSSVVIEISVVGPQVSRPGIRVHRVEDLAEGDRDVREGIPITSCARTIMDVAAILSTRELEGVVARAIRAGLVTEDTLLARLRRGRRHGSRALRAVLSAPGGPAFTRSAAEEKFLGLVRKARLPAPECNVRVLRYEIDFLWRTAGVAVEIDGYEYHSSRGSFNADRERDTELLAAGITVLRLSWGQVVGDPLATAVQVGQVLARALPAGDG